MDLQLEEGQAQVVRPPYVDLVAYKYTPVAGATWYQRLFGRLIVLWQGVRTGRPGAFKHAMLGISEDLEISQELHVLERPLSHFKGLTVKRWYCTAWSERQRRRIIDDARLTLGRAYDTPGIVGQALRGVPLVGDWLAGLVQRPDLTWCSEHVATCVIPHDPAFMGGRTKITPDDLDRWLEDQPCWDYLILQP